MRVLAGVLALFFFSVSMASAQEVLGVFVTYSLDMEGSKVRGTVMTARLEKGKEVPQGYSLKRVAEFIAEDCASGKVGKIKMGGKKVNQRLGYVGQRFRMTCLGGPHRRFGATAVKVVIARQADGRDLAEYSVSEDGETTTTQRYR
ncbi:hypothetical protein [uncultured Roseovarius sp.]|uniref:hypothetical protein n=1 Tax=uncultured Roseovarius sp. TaxID=293344 RepID=UPI0026207DCE|nr:hypothetical protein [uncultured Roseovarius sp.]